MVRALVVYYSCYGHIAKMAEAAAAGARQVKGAQVSLKRVPETLPKDLLQKIGAWDAQKTFAEIPIANPNELAEYDCILFGTPTRFGNMAGQMKTFLDATGGLWAKGALEGKVGGVFTSSNTQHGGQESTILTFLPILMHHGMLISGLPYSYTGQCGSAEVVGGSPYGASTIAGDNGERFPSKAELDGAAYQAKKATEYAAKLIGKFQQ